MTHAGEQINDVHQPRAQRRQTSPLPAPLSPLIRLVFVQVSPRLLGFAPATPPGRVFLPANRWAALRGRSGGENLAIHMHFSLMPILKKKQQLSFSPLGGLAELPQEQQALTEQSGEKWTVCGVTKVSTLIILARMMSDISLNLESFLL